MKKIKKKTNRQLVRKQKKIKKSLIIAGCLILLLAFQMYRHEKRAEAMKKIEIGGPKIELKQNKVVEKIQPTGESSPDINPILELPSSDENVKRAYTDSTWQPTPTEQGEPHWLDLSDGSLDRREIRETILKVTEIPAAELVEWWLDGNETNKIIATVSNENSSEVYRLHLAWQTNQGWLVEKIEELKKLPDFH